MSTRTKESEARFDTGRYVVIVRSELFRKDGYFEVRAIDKSTLRYSCVNNMNGLLGEFAGDDVDNPMYEDSSWVGSIWQVRRWFKRAKDLFSDICYLGYFEKLLDEDRLAGEWENKL